MLRLLSLIHAKQASTCSLAFDRQTGSSQTIGFSIVVCLLCYLEIMPDPVLLVVYYITVGRMIGEECHALTIHQAQNSIV